MPLYLVRWPELKASIIRADSAEHLLDVIDEVADPSLCTWQVYRGPMWVDFELPAKYRIEERVPGRLQPEEVVVEDVREMVEDILRVGPDNESETAWEMREAVLKAAFPHVEAARPEPEEEPDLPALEAAVVAELVEQERATDGQGVTWDEDLRLLATRHSYYLRTAPGRFNEVERQSFNDFCLGNAAIKPEADGVVRVARVEVVLRGHKPSHAVVKPGVALRADPTGRIVAAHRADAFPDEDQRLSGSERLRERRNKAVQWAPDDRDIRALAALVRGAEKCDLTFSSPDTQ